MEYHDKVLKCGECGAEFVFTAGEQMFFADKGFKNEPKRCKACKANRAQGNESGTGSAQRVETKTVCSQCGKETTVPFQADTRAPGILPRVLSAAAIDRDLRTRQPRSRIEGRDPPTALVGQRPSSRHSPDRFDEAVGIVQAALLTRSSRREEPLRFARRRLLKSCCSRDRS